MKMSQEEKWNWPRSDISEVMPGECFNRADTDHDGNQHGSVCISRENAITTHETFVEYLRASFVLGRTCVQWSWGQPFWFTVRQTIEIGIKIEIQRETGTWQHGHKLVALLEVLDEGSMLRSNKPLETFIRRMASYDPAGDEGRYQTTRGGTPSLVDVCCVEPEKCLFFIDELRKVVMRDYEWPAWD